MKHGHNFTLIQHHPIRHNHHNFTQHTNQNFTQNYFQLLTKGKEAQEKFKNHKGGPPKHHGNDGEKRCGIVPAMVAGCIQGYVVRVSARRRRQLKATKLLQLNFFLNFQSCPESKWTGSELIALQLKCQKGISNFSLLSNPILQPMNATSSRAVQRPSRNAQPSKQPQ
jgi:hypothetical protein